MTATGAAPKGASRRWNPRPSSGLGVLLAAPLAVLVIGGVLYPAGKLVIDALGSPASLESFTDFFSRPARVRAFSVTMGISATVTVLAVVGGWTLAWMMVNARSRYIKGLLWLATMTPLLMGVVVKNYVFSILLARNGPVSSGLLAVGVVDEPPRLLYTEFAVVLGMLYSMLPYAILPLYIGLREIDRDLVWASRGLGASRIRVIRTIIVPLSFQSAIAAGLLVFVVCIGFFVTPVILGGAQSPFVATLVQQDIYNYYDFRSAATASSVLLLTAFIVLFLAWIIAGGRRLRQAVLAR